MVRKIASQAGGGGGGSGFSLPVPTTDYEQVVTRDKVEIIPASEETVLEVELNESALWYEVGTTDVTYSTYYYLKDGEQVFPNGQRESLGLFNDLYRFPQPLICEESIEIRVARDSDAPGKEGYLSKLRYLPIDDAKAASFKDVIDQL